MSTATLLEAPALQSAAPLDKDRRRSKRVPQVVEAWIASPTATDPDDCDEVLAINLSRHGMAFDHKVPLPVGTFHRVDVSFAGQRMRTEIRIMNCRQIPNGHYEIGAEFC